MLAEFGDVGLMTGDVTINPTASCLVMTTEVCGQKSPYRRNVPLNPSFRISLDSAFDALSRI